MTLGEQVAALRRTLNRAVRRRLALETKRPWAHLLALRVIARGEVQTQAQLAERLGMDPAAVSRLVDRLKADGLLRRLQGTDRRCVRLEVTPAAKPELKTIDAGIRWIDHQVKCHLSQAELATVRRLLAKVQSAFTQEL